MRFVVTLVLFLIVYAWAISQSQFSTNKLISVGIGGFGGSQGIFTGDLDGDGYPEVLTIVGFSVRYKGNQGGESFFVDYPIASLPNLDLAFAELAVQDFDGDGDGDFVYGTRNQANSDVAHMNEFGLFRKDHVGPIGSFERVLIDSSMMDYSNVFLSDLNSDGLDDAIVTLSEEFDVLASHMYYYPSLGNGSFGPKITIFENQLIQGFEVQDIDDDGDLDILTRLSHLEVNDAGIFLFKNNGLGDAFEKNFLSNPAIAHVTNSNNDRAFTFDFNADGKLDLLGRTQAPNGEDYLALYFNDGNWNFSDSVLVSLGVPYLVLAFDADGDNDIDIVESVLNTTTYYFRNKGDGTFQEKVELYDFNWANRLLSADLDVDGDLDIITRNLTDLYWWENIEGSPHSSFAIVDCKDSLSNQSIAYYPSSSFHWDFGNGEYSSEVIPEFPYDTIGEYTLSLTTCNNFGCDTATQTIEISHIVDFEFPLVAEVGQEVDFIDSSVGYTNWSWILGDEAVSTNQITSYIFNEIGDYEIELFLTDADLVDCTYGFKRTLQVVASLNNQTLSQSTIRVFPNPCSKFCTISNPNNKTLEYQLFNVEGELKESGEFHQEYFALNITDLNAGLYYLRTTSTKGNETLNKIIVSP